MGIEGRAERVITGDQLRGLSGELEAISRTLFREVGGTNGDEARLKWHDYKALGSAIELLDNLQNPGPGGEISFRLPSGTQIRSQLPSLIRSATMLPENDERINQLG